MTDFSALGPSVNDGIYLGMPEDEYHAAGAASASLFKSLAISPLTAWARHIDPEREDESTGAQDLGTALHKRILEGEDAFRSRCAVLPEKDGDWLDGVAELKARCEELGLKKGGTVADLCARILEKDPQAKLWPLRMKAFHAENAGKILIKPQDWHDMEIPARFIRAHPFAGKAFEGGYPEVSIFWHDADGTPCKCRVDYLKIKAAIDLKYFANKSGLPINLAVARAIANESHHVQARHYIDGLAAAKAHAKAGKVFGSVDPEWVKAFAAATDLKFIWVFIQKGNVPEVRVKEFARLIPEALGGAGENAYWTNATDRVRDAKDMLRQCLDTYGADPSMPWLAPEPMSVLRDEELPLYMLN